MQVWEVSRGQSVAVQSDVQQHWEPAIPGMDAGAPYLPLLPEFRRKFPGVRPVALIASVCFHTPIIRDLVSWCGVRQVRLILLLSSLMFSLSLMAACPSICLTSQYSKLSQRLQKTYQGFLQGDAAHVCACFAGACMC